jgi:hypothetical protein
MLPFENFVWVPCVPIFLVLHLGDTSNLAQKNVIRLSPSAIGARFLPLLVTSKTKRVSVSQCAGSLGLLRSENGTKILR